MTWTRLAQAVWHIFVPARTPAASAPAQQHPEGALRVQTVLCPPHLSKLKRRNSSMSPSARVRDWHVQTPTHSSYGPGDLAGPRSPLSSPALPPRKRSKRKHDSHVDNEGSARKRGRTTKRNMDIAETQELDADDSDTSDDESSIGPTPHDSDYSPSMHSEIRVASISPASRLMRSQKREQHPTIDLDGLPDSEHSFYDYTTSSASLPATPTGNEASHYTQGLKTPVITSSVTPPSPSPRTRTAAQTPFDTSTFPTRVRPFITHLLQRGYEAILPSHWTMDFKYLPTSLFCLPNETPLVRASLTTDFRAQHAFSELLKLGARTRDLILAKRESEGPACRSIQAYLAWALKDASVDDEQAPDMVVFHHGDRRSDTKTLQRDAAWKLLMAHERWAAYLGHANVPPVYGVVISATTLALVCWGGADGEIDHVQDEELRIDQVERELKLVGVFDLHTPGLDVWNALALVLLAMHVRSEMASLLQES